MSEQQHCVWSFHGSSIQASGPSAVLQALASRLGSLPPNEISSPRLSFEFQAAPSVESHLIQKPLGESRTFYVPAAGEALYYPKDDLLFLDYEGRARSLCHPADGRCYLSLLEPEQDQLWLATHPLFTLPLLEMMKRRGMFNVHAACFALDGNGLMLAGTSGAGKSTLAIALLQFGLDFLGDDMVFLEKTASNPSLEMEMLAFPEKIDISANTIAFFAELGSLASHAKRPGWPKHEIDARDVFHSRIAWRAKPTAIVFPKIGHNSESKITPMSSDEAFLDLAPNVLLTEAVSTRAHFEMLADLVKRVPAYRLSTGTDFTRVSQMLGELIR